VTDTDKSGYIVLTAVGPDRPGLVKEISALIHRSGANLEDSRMAILGGEFALLVLVAGPAQALGRIQSEARELEQRLGLKLLVTPTERARQEGRYLPYRLRVTGVDNPGIVQKVTAILADRNVNVASLDSRIAYAPLSGTPMFILDALLQVPSELALSELRRELGAVCDRDNLDFTLEAGA
jgi:glycine cleavage system transcriptional repressor